MDGLLETGTCQIIPLQDRVCCYYKASTRLMRSSVAGGVSRSSSCIDFHPRRAIQLLRKGVLPVHRLLRVLPMNSA